MFLWSGVDFLWLGAGHTAGPAGRPASRTARPGPAACPAGQPAGQPAAGRTVGPTGRLMPARRPAADRPRASSLASRRAVAGEPPPPLICSLLFIKGLQSDLFLEPPTARGKLRSRRSEKSDALICYRTAQPHFRCWKRRRTAVQSAETSSSAGENPGLFREK